MNELDVKRYELKIHHLEQAVKAGNRMFAHFADLTIDMSERDDWSEELRVCQAYLDSIISNWAAPTPAWMQHYYDDDLLEVKDD